MLGLGILLSLKLAIPARMSTTSILVRRAAISDLDTVSSLFDAYRVFYEQESDPIAARQFMQTRLEKEDSTIFLAFNDADQSCGFTQLYPLFSSVRMRSIWLLNDLFVAKEARRMGVARALMLRAQDFARETGAAGLELATAKDNDAAKSVYHDLGWNLDSEFDHYRITV
jgi:ribosomal protein S18 acetylase RimI-like enzyme